MDLLGRNQSADYCSTGRAHGRKLGRKQRRSITYPRQAKSAPIRDEVSLSVYFVFDTRGVGVLVDG